MTIATQLKTTVAKTRALAANTRTKAAALGALAFVSAGSALASDSSPAQQAFDSLKSQAADMASSAWPVVTAIVGSLLAIGLFKKFASKAT